MYNELEKILAQSDNTVFFGGANVDTESGIPGSRSQNGIHSKRTYPYRAETMINGELFHGHPEQFYGFHFHETVYGRAQSNDTHPALAKLEEMGKSKAVIAQNIDGLHQKAGSHKVLEFHDSIHHNRCRRCRAEYDLQEMLKQKRQALRRPSCNGILEPEAVSHGESLDMQVMEEVIPFLSQVDVLIVGGTSLVVYPAAELLQYFRGSKLTLTNREETVMDHKADLITHDAIGKVMKEAVLV